MQTLNNVGGKSSKSTNGHNRKKEWKNALKATEFTTPTFCALFIFKYRNRFNDPPTIFFNVSDDLKCRNANHFVIHVLFYFISLEFYIFRSDRLDARISTGDGWNGCSRASYYVVRAFGRSVRENAENVSLCVGIDLARDGRKVVEAKPPWRNTQEWEMRRPFRRGNWKGSLCYKMKYIDGVTDILGKEWKNYCFIAP